MRQWWLQIQTPSHQLGDGLIWNLMARLQSSGTSN
jgi:hypothetical protein